ncbi:MAG: sensor domain-containing diguanylate cyclase [Candidatus Omnitrophica bacterium]|nr:sensor domain-containing diguanylate cyclase [Candidatus Omnitrophota bacterium]
MDKVITLLPFISILFLIVFWVFSPNMGAALLTITIPFVIFAVYSNLKRKELLSELRDTVKSFQAEKEEIIKEIQKKEKKQRAQNEELRQFGKSLSTAINKDQLLRLIVKNFSKVTESKEGESQCFLLSRQQGTDEFIYEAGHNFDSNTLKSMRFSENDEIIQAVVKSKKINTFISDIFGGDSNIRYFLKEERTTYLSQLGSLALIPLIMEEEVWGIIVIFCREGAAANIKNDEAFFRLLVAQASIALGSAIHRGLASIDKLTQLYNRTFLQKRMNEEVEFCNRQLLPLSLLMLDIDHFKLINDTYGHQEGDMVLKKIAQIISKSVRLTDICARYGGEEFVIVLPGIEEIANDKFSIAEKLRQAVESSDFVVLGDKHIKVTISIGVTVGRYPEDKDLGMDAFIQKADLLLYKAKEAGRNRVCYS